MNNLFVYLIVVFIIKAIQVNENAVLYNRNLHTYNENKKYIFFKINIFPLTIFYYNTNLLLFKYY